jgi:glutamate N-acetyltransferase/amino-acid N-acetyltransferase
MATMLCFITTDLKIDLQCLKYSLIDSVKKSFNKITVDGDKSTNDTVFFLANGMAGNKELKLRSKNYPVFKRALDYVTLKLAKDIVKDGEGATKFIEIEVKKAKSQKEAKTIAYSIANSPLVKTAFFGENPNWGRIMAAIGYSGVNITPEKIDIYFNGRLVVKGGLQAGIIPKNILKKKNIIVTVDLKAGSFTETLFTCDFSYNYVKINV